MYNKYKFLQLAWDIANKAHEGQTRDINKEPYIRHPERVAQQVSYLGWQYEIVGLLHDVIEDSYLRLPDISRYFHSLYEENGIDIQSLLFPLQVLKKEVGEPYCEYIKGMKVVVKSNTKHTSDIIKQVKLADLTDNLRDLPKGARRDKYELSKYILES